MADESTTPTTKESPLRRRIALVIVGVALCGSVMLAFSASGWSSPLTHQDENKPRLVPAVAAAAPPPQMRGLREQEAAATNDHHHHHHSHLYPQLGDAAAFVVRMESQLRSRPCPAPAIRMESDLRAKPCPAPIVLANALRAKPCPAPAAAMPPV